MGHKNNLRSKTLTPRCKAKPQEGPKVQQLQVHIPVVVASRYCEVTKMWVFAIYGGPSNSKYEHVMYGNRVGVWRGATWL